MSIPVAGIRGGPKTRQEQTEPHSTANLRTIISSSMLLIESHTQDFATFEQIHKNEQEMHLRY